MLRRCLLFAVAFCPLVVLAGEPLAPTPPKLYDVQIHYRIAAFRNERIVQFAQMMRYLQEVGFRRDPDEVVPDNEAEDQNATRLRGTVPADRARLLLGDRHVKSILLLPHGAKMPPDPKQLVRVDLTLNSAGPRGQRILSDQTFEVLASLGFRAAVGYDTRGFTRLLGSLPAGQVETLLTDLRLQPAAEKMGPPFQSVWPLRITEALPEMPLPAARPRPPAVPKGQEAITADLREVLADAGRAATPTRLEVVLATEPAARERDWAVPLMRAAPGLVVEGRLGQVVSVRARPDQAVALAALPEVAAVRLPRLPQTDMRPAALKDTNWKPVQASGLARLQAMGHRGSGTRLAVIGADFRGWQALVGKGLPASTRLIDLTAERNPDLLPDPFPAPRPGELPAADRAPSKDEAPGAGTRCARTVTAAAPAVVLTLIRIDPAAPYMLDLAARAINGDPYRSISLENRLADLENERDQLAARRAALVEERQAVVRNFEERQETEKRLLEQAEKQKLTPEQVRTLPGFDMLPAGAQARLLYTVRQKALQRDEQAYYERLQRYLQYQRDLASLRGIRVVACPFVWGEGYPVDGTSTLSRYFDDSPFRGALWFQAAGNTRGQSWVGPFRDENADGVMEFAPFSRPLPEDVWTPELNFLSWRSANGQETAALPAGTRLRVAVQWREAHEPIFARTGEDPYREPLARVRLLLLRQLDPAGGRRPADDLEVAAQSAGLPQRLVQADNFAVYEQTVDLVVKQAGRYALRVEGRPPETTRPPGAPTLPSMQRYGELRLRLFVDTLGDTGRAVFEDFATAAGSVGMPSDARAAITVGAADARNRPQPYSAGGPPFDLALLPKPDVLAYDDGGGTAEATCFAAGLAAVAQGLGSPRKGFLEYLEVGRGGVLRIPATWPPSRPKRCQD
jgi:hypothetical protein